MAAENGRNGSRVWFPVSMFLAGSLLTGTAGVVRGDWLGTRAAEAVETRLQTQVDDLRAQYRFLAAQNSQLLAGMARIEGKLDSK